MIKHIVIWKMKDEAEGNSKDANMALMRQKLSDLKGVIPQISSLEVGINMNPTDAAYDITLISTHKDEKALKEYAAHPAHLEAVQFVSKVVSDRKVVDYEY